MIKLGIKAPIATPTKPRKPTRIILNIKLNIPSSKIKGARNRCRLTPMMVDTAMDRAPPSNTTAARIRRISPEVAPYSGPIQRLMNDSPRHQNVATMGPVMSVAILPAPITGRSTSSPPKAFRALIRGIMTVDIPLTTFLAYSHKLAAMAKKVTNPIGRNAAMTRVAL